MDGENVEKIRASNIIWNSAGDYSFQSEVKAYDEDGRADLYFNYIIGAVHRYWDYELIQDYFDTLESRPHRELYMDLFWLGLENCAYLRGLGERPVLRSLRRRYAQGYMRRREMADLDADALDASHTDYTLDEIRTVHFRRALGEEAVASGLAQGVLSALEFPADVTEEQMGQRMDGLIKDYFEAGLLAPRERKRRRKHSIAFLKLGRSSFADYSMGLEFDEEMRRKNDAFSRLMKLPSMGPEARRSYVLGCYGESVLSEEETGAIERRLCTGIHGGCRLLYTRGEHISVPKRFSDVEKFRAAAKAQRDKNIKFYRANGEKNAAAISRLTNIIKNAVLINREPPSAHAEFGELDAPSAWRSLYLDDGRIFLRSRKDQQEEMCVDLMLDSSASQAGMQEIIAQQAYIIAESFTRCRIPVRIFSFCSDNEYTVLHTYREYRENDKNAEVFSYFASGCNRDGLAVRAAVDMIRGGEFQTKVLIVLSDGLPNDTQGISTGGAICDYLGLQGNNDTALEVRRGMQQGINVLCVFTGRDAHVQAAKRIYGHDMAYVRDRNRFADIVGVLIRKQLCEK